MGCPSSNSGQHAEMHFLQISFKSGRLQAWLLKHIVWVKLFIFSINNKIVVFVVTGLKEFRVRMTVLGTGNPFLEGGTPALPKSVLNSLQISVNTLKASHPLSTVTTFMLQNILVRTGH